MNQQLARAMLLRLGYQADVVGNGQEAVDVVMTVPYDLVLMDCQMPVMDGFEATRAIREREGTTRHTRIVAVTANAMEGDRERCLDVGMDDYLSKPFRAGDLQRVLDRWLGVEPAADLAAVAADRRLDRPESGPYDPLSMTTAPVAIDRPPCEVLACLAGEPGAFLLDVPDPQRPVTLVGCAPTAELRVEANATDPLGTIARFVDETPLRADDLPFPLAGGVLACFAYELGAHTVPGRAAGADVAPDRARRVCRYDLSVYDRRRGGRSSRHPVRAGPSSGDEHPWRGPPTRGLRLRSRRLPDGDP